MELYAKIFIVLAFVRLFESLLNINRKKLSSYDSKRFDVLDDRYYKIVFLSDVILCIAITLISLLSPIINSLSLYSAICSLITVVTIELCKYIGLRKMYIKRLT